MVDERSSTGGQLFWRSTVAGIIIAVASGIILAYLKGWLPLPGKQRSSSVEPEVTQSPLETTVFDTVESGDHRQPSPRRTDDSKNSRTPPTVDPESDNSQRYSLMISYDENCEAIASGLRNCLRKRKYYKQLEVQMEKLHRNRRDGTKCSIEFLYRDATQENFAKKIWTNLTQCRDDIEKRTDSTIDSEFKIVIEFKKEEEP